VGEILGAPMDANGGNNNWNYFVIGGSEAPCAIEVGATVKLIE
jgi:hypothetical protein